MRLDGSRLRRARELAGISQRDLASRVGLSEQQIYRYERERSDPLVSNVVAIAKELNVSIDYLCGLSDDPNPKNNQKLSDGEQELVGAWRRGDMDAVLELFRQKLKSYRDVKRQVPVKPAVNQD
jgi:transcriptional regulator with XRE-family HTH domain